MRTPPLALLLLLPACGSLEVTVDVLDPKAIEAEVERLQYREELERALAQSREQLAQDLLEIKRIHDDYLSGVETKFTDYAESLGEEAESLGEEAESLGKEQEALSIEIARDFYTSIAKELSSIDRPAREKKYEEVLERVWSIYLEARAMAGLQDRAKKDKAARIDRELVQLAKAAGRVKAAYADHVEQDTRRAKRQIEEDLGVLTDEIRGQIAQSSDKAQQEIDAAKKSLVGGGDLFQDALAYTVSSAPDSAWGNHYNRVIGRGEFGNLNVAIKMNSPADFTLKGLTFDPSQVASIAAKVSTQALLVATQISGVPVDLAGGSQQAGPGLSASSRALASIEAELAGAEARRADFEDALLTIGLAITRESQGGGLTSADAGRRQRSAAAILATYTAHKGRLSPEAPADSKDPEAPEE